MRYQRRCVYCGQAARSGSSQAIAYNNEGNVCHLLCWEEWREAARVLDLFQAADDWDSAAEVN